MLVCETMRVVGWKKKKFVFLYPTALNAFALVVFMFSLCACAQLLSKHRRKKEVVTTLPLHFMPLHCPLDDLPSSCFHHLLSLDHSFPVPPNYESFCISVLSCFPEPKHMSCYEQHI